MKKYNIFQKIERNLKAKILKKIRKDDYEIRAIDIARRKKYIYQTEDFETFENYKKYTKNNYIVIYIYEGGNKYRVFTNTSESEYLQLLRKAKLEQLNSYEKR